MTLLKSPSRQIKMILPIVFLFCFSVLLRFLYLGTIFQSSDNARLAANIILFPGYAWMIKENYGFLINLYTKLFVRLVSLLGITVTELVWKTPVALIGALQPPLTYFFLRRMGCKKIGSFCGAALISVAPLHVFQSRFLGGQEVLGVFFVTLAIWKLVDFFEVPTVRTGLIASFFVGLYQISHGYILPFLPCLICISVLFASTYPEAPFLKSFWLSSLLSIKNFLWLFPLLFVPLSYYSLRHIFIDRGGGKLGCYLFDYIPVFVATLGLPLTLFFCLSVIVSIFSKKVRSKKNILFIICGSLYLIPIFIDISPDSGTVVSGYFLMGAYFLILQLSCVCDELVKSHQKIIGFLVCVCFLATFWGTVESIFGQDKWFDPSLVKKERGDISDPGSKAAGYLIRKYVPSSSKVLAIHRKIEPPVLFYYFGRNDYSWFDLSLNKSINKFLEYKDEADVVVCEEKQKSVVGADGGFKKRVVIYSDSEDEPMLIYTRSWINIPAADISPRERIRLNNAYDKEYAIGWREIYRDVR